MTLMDHVARYVALKRRLGYDYRTHAAILRRYARFGHGNDRELRAVCARLPSASFWQGSSDSLESARH